MEDKLKSLYWFSRSSAFSKFSETKLMHILWEKHVTNVWMEYPTNKHEIKVPEHLKEYM